MNRKVVVIGSTNVDMTIQLDHLPRLGETVTNGEFYQAFGGKGAVQAVGAARSGGNVIFVTCLGSDNYASLLLESFKKDNILTDYIITESGVGTGTALIMTDSQGRNCIGVAPGANDFLLPESIDSAFPAIKDAEMVLLQCEIPHETNKHVIDLCHKLGKKVILNLAPARIVEDSYLAKLHLLVANETEAEILSGNKVHSPADIEKVAEKLLSMGPENVIITLGARGSFVATKDAKFFVESYLVDAVDSTGAGDIFCGALAVALTQGKNYREAVTFATAAAGISVTRLGALPSAPRKEEIEDFIKNH